MKIPAMLMAITFLAACGQQDSNDSRAKQVRDAVEDINRKVEPNEKVDVESPLTNNENEFFKNICQNINERNLDNPFKVGKYFENNYFFRSLQQLSAFNGKFKCLGTEVLIDSYPMGLVKVKTDMGLDVVFGVHYNRHNLIDAISSFLGSNVIAKKYMVKTEKNLKLATFFFGNPDKSLPTIYIRSPYVHSNFATYIAYINYFLGKNLNVIIQQNRGVHLSDGHFRWLHEENIIDGKNTVEWIARQRFNNGKVIPYGVSYDGFNALATAASDADAIIGTIACSAPANAMTDSFSSNQKIEYAMLRYIFEREDTLLPDHINEKIMYSLNNFSDGLENLDNYVFERKIQDWKDLYKSISNDDSQYWSDRNIIDELSEVTKPVYHIAGFANDQDGRDTILAYNEVIKTDSKDMHYFYLHQGGHGCGDLMTNGDFDKFIKEDFSNIARTGVYNLSSKSVYKTEEFYTGAVGEVKIEDLTIVDKPVLNDNVKAKRGDNYKVLSAMSLNEDTYVNGMPVLHIKGNHDTAYAFLTASISKLRRDGTVEILHTTMSAESRFGVYLDNANDKFKPFETSITFPPINTKLLTGESLIVSINSQYAWAIDTNEIKRKQYYKQKLSSGIINLEKLQLTLPTEKTLN